MYGAVIHAPGDVRYEERDEPTIIDPTDAVVRTVAACVCGSDLWRYRGISPVPKPTPIGHEFCGVVEEVGSAVTSVKPGDFVVGGFNPSDNTCPVCRKGAHANCQHGDHYNGAQASRIRIPQADGTLLATPGMPDDDLVPSILALSDVMCTGWHAAVSAGVGPDTTVAVVGDGAVGLSAVLAAVQLGVEPFRGDHRRIRVFPVRAEQMAHLSEPPIDQAVRAVDRRNQPRLRTATTRPLPEPDMQLPELTQVRPPIADVELR